jgi:hypothetical protein
MSGGSPTAKVPLRSYRHREWPAGPGNAGLLPDSGERRPGGSGLSGLRAGCLPDQKYEPGTWLTLHQDKNERDYARTRYLSSAMRRADRGRRSAVSSVHANGADGEFLRGRSI